MEPFMSRWILEEYREATAIASSSGVNLLIAGANNPIVEATLRRQNIPYTDRHSWEICDTPGTIVLDLWADKDLETWEALNASCFVIGGIMGDHPPRGRGIILRSMFDWATIRRLGPLQFSVDTTVRVIAMILEGRRLSNINTASNVKLSIETPLGPVEVILPFAYVLNDQGRPLVARGIMKLLSHGIMWDEEILSS